MYIIHTYKFWKVILLQLPKWVYSITLFDKVKNIEKKEHCLKQFKKLLPMIHFIDGDKFI